MNIESFLKTDRQDILRTRNLRLVPEKWADRKGGKRSYAEWCYVIGIFQTLICQSLAHGSDNHILDVGCGNGILAIAAEPFIGEKGRFIGLDISEARVNFCRRHYRLTNYSFVHHNVKNNWYAPEQPNIRRPWPLESESFDLITALSVWTHLNQQDSLYYLSEISRVLKTEGKAIITFFILNAAYYDSLKLRTDQPGRYHMTSQRQWIFDRPVPGQEHWYCLDELPEKAMAVDEQGLKMLLEHAGLSVTQLYEGNWKELPGIFFQDILILEKRKKHV